MMRMLYPSYALVAGLLAVSSAWAQETPPAAGASDAPADAAPPGEQAITALPQLLEAVEAHYPERALAEGIESSVMLEIDLDTQGRVERVEVKEPASAPGYGFEEAAVAAVRQFRFSPAMAGDTPIPVRISYRYRFMLQAPPAPAPVAPEAEAAAKAPKVVNLDGQLLVRGTREPIAGVTVTVFRGAVAQPEQAFEAQTDKEGNFAFYDLTPGAWNVLVEADGFFPVRSSETVEAGERTHVRYYVEKGTYNPFDVLVEATRPRREVSRASLQIEEIERVPGTAGDALQVIQNLPGVARSPLLSGQIIVRGAAPEDTQTVVESMRIPLIYHFGGLRSVIPTPMLEGIDFYPGNFSPEFGRAIGGIIDVRLKELKPERFGGKADVSIMDASLYLETPIGKKAAVAVAARRSYLDGVIKAATSGSDDINVVTAPRYYDAQLLLQYRPAEGHQLRAFGLLSNDQLRLLFSNPGDASLAVSGNRLRSSTAFYRGLVDYAYTPSTRFTNSLRASFGSDDDNIQLAQFRLENQELSLQVRDTASLRLNQHLRIEIGLDELYQRFDYSVLVPRPTREGENGPRAGGGPDGGPGGGMPDSLSDAVSSEVRGLDANSFGAFSQLELTFKGLSLFPGVRYDYFSRTNAQRVSPRLTARYAVNPQWTVKGGAGLFYQEPTIDETDKSFGNPALDPEGAVHYSGGVEYRPRKHLTFDVTGFYKTLFDVVAPSDRILERDGELVREQLSNRGKGRVIGAELVARHEFAGNFIGWISYTIMRSERKDSPEDPWRLFDYDQTHILTALGTYRLPRNWEVGFRFRLISGNPTTPAQRGILNSDTDEYESVNERVNSARVPPFHQLDLRIDKQWIYQTWRFSAYLDVQNVYNRKNPDQVQYKFDFSEKKYTQSLPILPILGLRAEY